MKNETGVHGPKISVDKIIEVIKEGRDKRIKELLQGNGLRLFLEERYDTISVSPVKEEFLRRDLKELQAASMDLAHYSSLIKLTKESGSFELVDNHPLFFEELKFIFSKYGL